MHNYQVHRIVLPLASCLLPLASCLLPIAYCLLPVACYLLRSSYQVKVENVKVSNKSHQRIKDLI
ncbi:hypothetical protein [Moorena producens]|uniref:hypothetical protein n=1 Tax=Moorena producens TaxID=1155739 RepID=UPI003C78A3C1